MNPMKRRIESTDLNDPKIEARIRSCINGGMGVKTMAERFKVHKDAMSSKVKELKERGK